MIYEFGNRLRNLRESCHYTQAEVAKLTNMSPTIISQYEGESCQPAVEVLIKLAELYGVPVDYLMGLDESLSLISKDLNSEEKMFLKAMNKNINDFLNS